MRSWKKCRIGYLTECDKARIDYSTSQRHYVHRRTAIDLKFEVLDLGLTRCSVDVYRRFIPGELEGLGDMNLGLSSRTY
jgi:hypothetical protein